MYQAYKKAGFTLIELLVVIVILGILSTISVGTFRSYFAKARDSERVSTVQNLAMMVKVDSGGSGDCGVYNYTDGGDTTTTSGDACTTEGDFAMLLTDNDYAMPSIKNGLAYYYGFILGETEGENEFFIATGAEEDAAQNGQVAAGGESIFIDGTTEGIDEGKVCSWGTGVTCNAEVSLYILNSNGAPIDVAGTSCDVYLSDAECPEPVCVWDGSCTVSPYTQETEQECINLPYYGVWTGGCSAAP